MDFWSIFLNYGHLNHDFLNYCISGLLPFDLFSHFYLVCSLFYTCIIIALTRKGRLEKPHWAFSWRSIESLTRSIFSELRTSEPRFSEPRCNRATIFLFWTTNFSPKICKIKGSNSRTSSHHSNLSQICRNSYKINTNCWQSMMPYAIHSESISKSVEIQVLGP